MSSDDAVYVAEMSDNDYRVTDLSVSCLDNIQYEYDQGLIDKQERKAKDRKAFENAKSFSTKNEAIIAAHKIQDEVHTEYGVVYVKV